jgi:hypothetical protein
VFRPARALVCVLFAAAAQAQLTTSRVDVHLTGDTCKEIRNVVLVIDDKDVNDRITLDPLHDKTHGSCWWTTNLGVDGSYSTTLSHFSLRVDFATKGEGARTDCHQAGANYDDLAGEIEFRCCSDRHFRDVHVTTDPPMSVSYLRRVPNKSEPRVRGIDCVEVGALAAGTGTIGHTQFPGEHIELQLGTPKPDRKVTGLILNDINDIAAGDGTLILTRDGVVYRLLVQRAKGKMRTVATFSSNAISLDIKKLGELKFRRAEFEVIK